MIGDVLIDIFGDEIDGFYGQVLGLDNLGYVIFVELVGDVFNGEGVYVVELYDVVVLMLLVMQVVGLIVFVDYKGLIEIVVNVLGELILLGELVKGLEIFVVGGDIDYVGVIGVELVNGGEVVGLYCVIIVEGGMMEIVEYC